MLALIVVVMPAKIVDVPVAVKLINPEAGELTPSVVLPADPIVILLPVLIVNEVGAVEVFEDTKVKLLAPIPVIVIGLP